MPTTQLELENEFRALLPGEAIRAASAADAVCGAQSKLVLEPGSEREIADALRHADEAGLAVVPRGGGTKIDWGNPPQRADVILSTARLDKIIEHVWADLTVSVESGCTIQKLQTALAQHGQRLAVDPLWPSHATIGGILSANDSGSLRLRFGPLRDLIIGVTIVLPDGTIASSGGKVVKNVAGYDLPKLVTGGIGTLGVITRAVFRVHPLPRYARTLSVSTGTLEKIQQVILEVQDSQLAHTSLQVRVAHYAEPEVDILFEGTEAGIAAQDAKFRELVRPAVVSEAAASIWSASQEIWDAGESAAIAKITTLPASLADTTELVKRVADSRDSKWQLTIQATGVGWLRLEGSPENLHAALTNLRGEIEAKGGSLVALHQPTGMARIDTWGQAGDALTLMQAVKSKFDPRNTLNPGRFVGGI